MDVCRLCMSNKELIWVFDQQLNSAENDMKTVILVTTGVEISQADVISQKICRTCGDNVVKLYKFRQQSQKNDQRLREEHKKLTQKKSPHGSIIELFRKYPRIHLPNVEICLAEDISPVVEMQMDEVEQYFKSKKLNFQKHVQQVLRQERQKERAKHPLLKTKETVSPISIKFRQDKSSYEIVHKRLEMELALQNSSLPHLGNHRKRQLSDSEQPSTSKRQQIDPDSSVIKPTVIRRQYIDSIELNYRPGPSDLDLSLMEALEASEKQNMPPRVIEIPFQPANIQVLTQPANPQVLSQTANPQVLSQPANPQVLSQRDNPQVLSQPANPQVLSQRDNSQVLSQNELYRPQQESSSKYICSNIKTNPLSLKRLPNVAINNEVSEKNPKPSMVFHNYLGIIPLKNSVEFLSPLTSQVPSVQLLNQNLISARLGQVPENIPLEYHSLKPCLVPPSNNLFGPFGGPKPLAPVRHINTKPSLVPPVNIPLEHLHNNLVVGKTCSLPQTINKLPKPSDINTHQKIADNPPEPNVQSKLPTAAISKLQTNIESLKGKISAEIILVDEFLNPIKSSVLNTGYEMPKGECSKLSKPLTAVISNDGLIQSMPETVEVSNSKQKIPEVLRSEAKFPCKFCKESFITQEKRKAHLEKCYTKKALDEPAYVLLENIQDNVDIKRKYLKAFSYFANTNSSTEIKEVIEILEDDNGKEKEQKPVDLILNLNPQVKINNSRFPNIDYKSDTSNIMKQLLAFDKNESPSDQNSQTDLTSENPELNNIVCGIRKLPNNDYIHPQNNGNISMNYLKSYMHLYKIPVNIDYGQNVEAKYKVEESPKRNKPYKDWNDLIPIDVTVVKNSSSVRKSSTPGAKESSTENTQIIAPVLSEACITNLAANVDMNSQEIKRILHSISNSPKPTNIVNEKLIVDIAATTKTTELPNSLSIDEKIEQLKLNNVNITLFDDNKLSNEEINATLPDLGSEELFVNDKDHVQVPRNSIDSVQSYDSVHSYDSTSTTSSQLYSNVSVTENYQLHCGNGPATQTNYMRGLINDGVELHRSSNQCGINFYQPNLANCQQCIEMYRPPPPSYGNNHPPPYTNNPPPHYSNNHTRSVVNTQNVRKSDDRIPNHQTYIQHRQRGSYSYTQNRNQNVSSELYMQNLVPDVSCNPKTVNYRLCTDNSRQTVNYNGSGQIREAIMPSDTINNVSSIRVRPLRDLR